MSSSKASIRPARTIARLRFQHRKLAAQHQPPDEVDAPLIYDAILAKCSDDGQCERGLKLQYLEVNRLKLIKKEIV